MASKSGGSGKNRRVYTEFGSRSDAFERGVPDLAPSQQDLRIQASRKGRKGKTVTIISGFQQAPDTLATLAKQLKAQCGTGGTVRDNTVEIQGDHATKLLELLRAKGYKAKLG